MSARILKPEGVKWGAQSSTISRRSMKKPLIRSEKSACRALLASLVAKRLIMARRSEKPSCAEPPSTWRLPTTRSQPARSFVSICGRIRSSCCKSASITATTGALEASMPSMQAPARPRRLTRRRQRTRESSREISLASMDVPSGLLSSTTIISQSTPVRAASTRRSNSRRLPLSLKVGMTSVSSVAKAGAFSCGLSFQAAFLLAALRPSVQPAVLRQAWDGRGRRRAKAARPLWNEANWARHGWTRKTKNGFALLAGAQNLHSDCCFTRLEICFRGDHRPWR